MTRADDTRSTPGGDPAERGITLEASALAEVRIATSQLWEVLASLAILTRVGDVPAAPYRTWARRAYRRLQERASPELSRWLAGWPPSRIPRFLLGEPQGVGGDLQSDLERLHAQQPDQTMKLLSQEYADGEVPSSFRSFLTDPEAAMQEQLDRLAEYHALVLEPYRLTLHRILEEEVFARARTLASGGVHDLLNHLHPRIRWAAPHLRLETTGTAPAGTMAQLTVVPVVFAREQLILSWADAGPVYLGYQSRGAGTLGDELGPLPSSQVSDALSILLGSGRAAVLRSLAEPATTTSIAERLGLAPSTVSEHLRALTSARVVSRRRRQNRVYYTLTERGHALLMTLESRQG